MYAILHNENETAKKIIDFSTQIGDCSIANKLKEEFKNAVKSGDFTKANKFYNFGKDNQLNIFEDELLKSSWLSDTISEIKHSKDTKFLENTLKFAKDKNILKEVFKAKVGSKQKTLLEVAEEEGVKERVEGVIRDVGIDRDSLDRVEDDDNQQSTFCSRNKGKIACGVGGTLFLIGGIVAASTLGQPLVGAAAIGAMVAGAIGAVVGAVMLSVAVLSITTDRGGEMWNGASSMLKDLFVSKQEQQQSH